MPIITERYSNPRWGFLEGLGQTPVTPRLLLRDPKTGAFSNERFEALKSILIDALQRARSDYQKIYNAANTNVFSAQTVKEAAARLRASLDKQTKPRLEIADARVRKFFDANYEGWDKPDEYNATLAYIQQEIKLLQGDAQVLQVASEMSFYNALAERAKVITQNLYEAGAGVGTSGLWFFKNLPWILGVGAVLLIAGPTIIGGITGGREGAARAAQADIERARGAVASGARGAKNAVTKGLFGNPSRRRRRRR